jgi:hypothetical protein
LYRRIDCFVLLLTTPITPPRGPTVPVAEPGPEPMVPGVELGADGIPGSG